MGIADMKKHIIARRAQEEADFPMVEYGAGLHIPDEREITDAPEDNLRRRASVHRGARYLEENAGAPGGSSGWHQPGGDDDLPSEPDITIGSLYEMGGDYLCLPSEDVLGLLGFGRKMKLPKSPKAKWRRAGRRSVELKVKRRSKKKGAAKKAAKGGAAKAAEAAKSTAVPAAARAAEAATKIPATVASLAKKKFGVEEIKRVLDAKLPPAVVKAAVQRAVARGQVRPADLKRAVEAKKFDRAAKVTTAVTDYFKSAAKSVERPAGAVQTARPSIVPGLSSGFARGLSPGFSPGFARGFSAAPSGVETAAATASVDAAPAAAKKAFFPSLMTRMFGDDPAPVEEGGEDPVDVPAGYAPLGRAWVLARTAPTTISFTMEDNEGVKTTLSQKVMWGGTTQHFAFPAVDLSGVLPGMNWLASGFVDAKWREDRAKAGDDFRWDQHAPTAAFLEAVALLFPASSRPAGQMASWRQVPADFYRIDGGSGDPDYFWPDGVPLDLLDYAYVNEALAGRLPDVEVPEEDRAALEAEMQAAASQLGFRVEDLARLWQGQMQMTLNEPVGRGGITTYEWSGQLRPGRGAETFEVAPPLRDEPPPPIESLPEGALADPAADPYSDPGYDPNAPPYDPYYGVPPSYAPQSPYGGYYGAYTSDPFVPDPYAALFDAEYGSGSGRSYYDVPLEPGGRATAEEAFPEDLWAEIEALLAESEAEGRPLEEGGFEPGSFDARALLDESASPEDAVFGDLASVRKKFGSLNKHRVKRRGESPVAVPLSLAREVQALVRVADPDWWKHHDLAGPWEYAVRNPTKVVVGSLKGDVVEVHPPSAQQSDSPGVIFFRSVESVVRQGPVLLLTPVFGGLVSVSTSPTFGGGKTVSGDVYWVQIQGGQIVRKPGEEVVGVKVAVARGGRTRGKQGVKFSGWVVTNPSMVTVWYGDSGPVKKRVLSSPIPKRLDMQGFGHFDVVVTGPPRYQNFIPQGPFTLLVDGQPFAAPVKWVSILGGDVRRR